MDLSKLQLLSDIIPQKVGSLLSINSIRQDLEVSHKLITKWITILESFYYHFRIYPFTSKNIRSLKKEPKIYLYDWSLIEDESIRFENFIASHLLKFVHFLKDYEGYKAQLYFLRDTDKREVDFLVTIDSKPWFCVEVKLNEEKISPQIKYFRDRLNIPFCYQVIKKKDVYYQKDDIIVVSGNRFLNGLI